MTTRRRQQPRRRLVVLVALVATMALLVASSSARPLSSGGGRLRRVHPAASPAGVPAAAGVRVGGVVRDKQLQRRMPTSLRELRWDPRCQAHI
uniref:Uncharacterized protein n=1 Tax=Oryza brachyantha TaxID=4533 RepID=J3MCX9_ORYBR